MVVNRQFCIANAFGQILEERLLGFRCFVRYVYDTCRFPIVRLNSDEACGRYRIYIDEAVGVNVFDSLHYHAHIL